MLLSWQQAAYLGAVLAVIAGVLFASPRGARPAPWVRETGVVLILYACWQEGLNLLATGTRGAIAHGLWVARLQRTLHLPGEAEVQRFALRVPSFVRACNLYYATVHVPALVVALLWVFWRHRDRYRWARRIMIWVTLPALLLQAIPVAPPRLLPSTGVVDAARLFGQSVYAPNGLHDPSQLIAMPSVHVAWALVVAAIVIRASTSRLRWLIIAHPVLTMVSVVVSGNHFWMDGIVAAALLGLVMAVDAAMTCSRPAQRSEAGPDLVDEQGRLLEGGEVTAPVQLVPVAQIGEPPLRPSS